MNIRFKVLMLMVTSIFCAEYSLLGITKDQGTVLKEFADSVTKILNSTGYIQCYDITKQVKILFTSPIVTLYNIEIMSLHTTNALLPSQLSYIISGGNATIHHSSNVFGIKARIHLKWKYTVSGVMIYQGNYEADLSTESASIDFNFVNNTNRFSGNITFKLKVSNAIVTGFGAAEMIKKTINEMFDETLALEINKELNRYNDIIVSSIIYNYYYRSIKLNSFYDWNNDYAYLKNVFKKFYIFTGNNTNYLSFAFNSSLYYAIEHKEYEIQGSFTPLDPLTNKISVHLGADALKNLYSIFLYITHRNMTYYPWHIIDVMGFPITTKTLSQFYPRISEDYSKEENTTLNCTRKEVSQGKYIGNYKCQFVLHNDPKVYLLDISNLQNAGDFDTFVDTQTDNKTLNVTNKNNKFISLIMKNPKLPYYTANQLMAFLQPFARYHTNRCIPYKIVGDNMNWDYVDIAKNENGDTTVFYKPQ